MWRRIALALVAYISLDFADPNMPGALNFELDRSVEAVSSQARAKLPSTHISLPPMLPRTGDAAVLTNAAPARPAMSVPRALPLHLRPRAVLSARAPATVDDH